MRASVFVCVREHEKLREYFAEWFTLAYKLEEENKETRKKRGNRPAPF